MSKFSKGVRIDLPLPFLSRDSWMSSESKKKNRNRKKKQRKKEIEKKENVVEYSFEQM